MGAVAHARRHDWRPGEKEINSVGNDIRSMEHTLSVLRQRNPPVGRIRAWIIRKLGGQIGRPREIEQIREVESTLDERRARMHELRVQYR